MSYFFLINNANFVYLGNLETYVKWCGIIESFDMIVFLGVDCRGLVCGVGDKLLTIFLGGTLLRL